MPARDGGDDRGGTEGGEGREGMGGGEDAKSIPRFGDELQGEERGEG